MQSTPTAVCALEPFSTRSISACRRTRRTTSRLFSGRIPRLTAILAGLLGACAAVQASAIVDAVPFSINSPYNAPLALPQFDPALGTLTDASITLSGTVQDYLQLSNTGNGPFSVSLQDYINLGSLQARIPFPVGGFIPANSPVYGFLLPPTPFSASTSLNGQLGEFTGPGAISFNLFVMNPIAQIQQGPTVTSVFSSLSATGNVTLNYTYTPAAPIAATPEPSTFAMCLTASAFALWMWRRRKTRRQRSTL